MTPKEREDKISENNKIIGKMRWDIEELKETLKVLDSKRLMLVRNVEAKFELISELKRQNNEMAREADNSPYLTLRNATRACFDTEDKGNGNPA